MSTITLGQQAAVFYQRRAPPSFLCKDRRHGLRPGLSSARKADATPAISIPRRDAILGFDTATFRWNTNSLRQISRERLRLRDTVRPISPQGSSNEDTSEEEDDGSSRQRSREKIELLFTCSRCDTQSKKKVNFRSLQKGTVFLQVGSVENGRVHQTCNIVISIIGFSPVSRLSSPLEIPTLSKS